jgi:hypothetical protein
MREPLRDINESAIEYWRHNKLNQERFDQVCQKLDGEAMFARVALNKGSDPVITLSTNTWKRQEGHYPTIADLFAAIVRHPMLEGLQGAFLVWLEDGMWEPSKWVSREIPVFAFGKHIHDQHTLLMPDPAFIESVGYASDREKMGGWRECLPWEDKIPTIFWRGAATGLGIEEHEWVKTPRGRLVLAAQKINEPDKVNAKISRIKHLSERQREVLRSSGVVGDEVPFHDFLKFKYTVDVDGYCCAWKSLFLKLLSGSATLKVQSVYEQWFHRELVAWKNYIPINPDCSDLKEIHEWMIQNDDAVRAITGKGLEMIDTVTFERSTDEVVSVCAEILRSIYQQ